MNRLLKAVLLLASAASAAGDIGTWTPGGSPLPSAGFVVDTTRRNEVLHFWNSVYLAPDPALGWTGTYADFSGSPGTTGIAHREAVRRRVNFYRAMTGLPADITFDAEVPGALPGFNNISTAVPVGTKRSDCAQHAAFMNAVETVYDPGWPLSHFPDGQQVAWSLRAANGCRHGNLAFGLNGPAAIDAYIEEQGQEDDLALADEVGHRRWILYSRAKDMATGDVPDGTLQGAPVTRANCLYVIGAPRALFTPAFIAWPSKGYFPAPLVSRYWSLGYPGANFSNASVRVTGPSGALTVRVLKRRADGVGDNVITWDVSGLPSNVTADFPCRVDVSGISGSGVPASASWEVILTDPDRLDAPVRLSGPPVLTQAGTVFTLPQVDAADEMEVQIARVAAAAGAVNEGAEDATAARVSARTGGGYELRQPALTQSFPGATIQFVPKSGAKSFHLTHTSPLSDESFVLERDFVPSAASVITFSECFRWLFTVNRLSLELSEDGGVTWSELYGRSGAYTFINGGAYNSSLWDKQSPNLQPFWHTRSVPLAAWEGKLVRLRFILRANGNGFNGTDQRFGCYLDDIAVSGIRDMTGDSTVRVPAGSSAVRLLPQQAPGGSVIAGASYFIRAQARLGGRLMGYGPHLAVTGSTAAGFDAWLLSYPMITGGPGGDHDLDGVKNLAEYAFGLDPLVPDSGALPQPVLDGGALTVAFPHPPGVTGITFAGDSSEDLARWTPLQDQGGGSGGHSFRFLVSGRAHGYIRLKVTAP